MSNDKLVDGLRIPPLRCWSSGRQGLPDPQQDWRVLRREGARLWVEKPGQLQVHPSKPTDPFTLWDGLVRHFAWEWVVEGAQVSILTRLDRETSGVVLVALSRVQARLWGKMLTRGLLQKEYVCLVHGWPDWQRRVCELPLLARASVDAQAPIFVEQMVHADGKAARTEFEVLERWERVVMGARRRFALLRAVPVTGRMHQIRVHAAALGYGLVGDKIYGQRESTYLRWIEEGWSAELAGRLLVPRQALHCARLVGPDFEVAAAVPDFLAGVGE